MNILEYNSCLSKIWKRKSQLEIERKAVIKKKSSEFKIGCEGTREACDCLALRVGACSGKLRWVQSR